MADTKQLAQKLQATEAAVRKTQTELKRQLEEERRNLTSQRTTIDQRVNDITSQLSKL